MSEKITITAHDGGTFSAYVARPQAEKAPAIIVIQEIFGVNAVMRALCDDLAAQGYLAICPDLFWRQEPGIDITDKSEAEWKKAFELFSGFNVELGVQDLKSTLAHIRKDSGCTGKAGTVGYCLGGKLAYLMAAESNADCNVSYYGVGIQDMLDKAAGIQTPLLMHIAGKDKFVPKEAQDKIIAGLRDNPHITIHTYADNDHAFARVGGEHYDVQAASLANGRTASFLANKLK